MDKEWITFDQSASEDVLDALGFDVEDGKVEKDGEQIECESCNKPITVDNFGVAVSDPVRIFCDNPACYSKQKAIELKEVEGEDE